MLETLVSYLRNNKDQNQKVQKKCALENELEIEEIEKLKLKEKEKTTSGQFKVNTNKIGNFGHKAENGKQEQLYKTTSGKQFQKLFLHGISPHQNKSQQKTMQIQLGIKNEREQNTLLYSEDQNCEQSGQINCQQILSY